MSAEYIFRMSLWPPGSPAEPSEMAVPERGGQCSPGPGYPKQSPGPEPSSLRLCRFLGRQEQTVVFFLDMARRGWEGWGKSMDSPPTTDPPSGAYQAPSLREDLDNE